MADFSGLRENFPVVLPDARISKDDEQDVSSLESTDRIDESGDPPSFHPIEYDKTIHDIFRVRELVAEKIVRPPAVFVHSQGLSKVEVYPSDCDLTSLILVDSSQGYVIIYLDDKEGNIINDEITIKDMSHDCSSSFDIAIRSFNVIEGYNQRGERILTKKGGYLVDSIGGSVTFRLAKINQEKIWLILAENLGNPRK
jgi:hypothetical protein